MSMDINEYNGDIVSFFENGIIAFKGKYKNDKLIDLGYSFNYEGKLQCFVADGGKTINLDEGRKILVSRRLSIY